jgi:hypothetical protein
MTVREKIVHGGASVEEARRRTRPSSREAPRRRTKNRSKNRTPGIHAENGEEDYH